MAPAAAPAAIAAAPAAAVADAPTAAAAVALEVVLPGCRFATLRHRDRRTLHNAPTGSGRAYCVAVLWSLTEQGARRMCVQAI